MDKTIDELAEEELQKLWQETEFQFSERVREVFQEELKEPERLWWLSFADNGFKGAIIVKAKGITHALTICNLKKINPGGEVYCVAIPDKAKQYATPDVMYRLLSKEEIDQRWGLMTLDEWDKQSE